MNKILGLDLGTNSIGWALRNTDLLENQIEKFGVITFNKGVGNSKTGEYSYAAERTKKRSARRLYQSRKYRLWATLENLIAEGYCPLSIENLNRWRKYSKEEAIKSKNGGRVYPVDDIAFDQWIKLDFDGDGKPDYQSPYQLRKELAELTKDFSLEINRYKLGRALYHIAQRRGFKSSRKSSDDIKAKESNDDESTDLKYSEVKRNKKIKEYFEEFPEAKTVGWLFAILEKNNVRIRENVSQFVIRENYKDEIKYIFSFQKLGYEHSLFKKLIETSNNKNDGSIFYKRPLRSQKGLIGKCTLEPNKYRAPTSHPSFELFRAWSFLNNVKYKTFDDSSWKRLPLDLKSELLNEKFFRKSRPYFPFSELIEFIAKKGYQWEFNYSSKTTISGCPVSARLRDIFGENYQNIKINKKGDYKGKNYYDLEDIWHVLFSFEDQEFVSAFAEEKLNLTPDKVKQFVIAWHSLPVGYGMLSINAIKKINRFLQKGLIYTEAVLLANIPSIIGEDNWNKNEDFLFESTTKVIEENRNEKTILNIVNNLISQYKNLEQKFGYKNADYILDNSDRKDVLNAIEQSLGKVSWQLKDDDEKKIITDIVSSCYQAYFTNLGFERRDINGERFQKIPVGNKFYYKSDSGYFRLPKLIETFFDFLKNTFKVEDKLLNKIYHPSEISIYPPAKANVDGKILLGSPQTGSFKNPMAMRTLHELKKLINYFIQTEQIDNETRIVVEVARELNDTNKRWAIETWQRQREAENKEFALAIDELVSREKVLANSQNSNDVDKLRIWYEQCDEESLPPISDSKKEVRGIKWIENKKDSYKQIVAQKQMVDKYRLWKEQEGICIYTGKPISISDLFSPNTIDFEHTIPRSISFDDSLANQTVCYHSYNRTIKKKLIPTQLNNYDKDSDGFSAILPRLSKWKEKVERIKQQIDFWKTKSKKASDKIWKDDAIRQKHLWQMELDYWQNKLERFTMREVTTGFKNSQKVDTQLISKYALHYLKSYFDRVDVQKGVITATFRKIYGLQVSDEKKDRTKHSHHAKDAAILTLIPSAAKRDEILQLYYEYQENYQTFTTLPYKQFRREYIAQIDYAILINNISNNQSLTPAKRKVRKRGKEQLIKGTKKIMWSTGDCIRGQLHQETFYGAIKPAKRDENGNILKDAEKNIIVEDKPRYVLRVPFQYKKDSNTPGFKTLEEIQKQIVDIGLKIQIEKQVVAAGGLKEAFDNKIYLLDRNGIPHGNPIRHIRVWASVSEPLKIKKQTNVSKKDYKQHYYAANATNSFFAIYEGDNKKKFTIRNLFEVAESISTEKITNPFELFENQLEIEKGKKKIQMNLKYILKPNSKIIFLKPNETIDNVKNMDVSNISLRLYFYTNFEKDGRLNFKHHLEARSKIEEVYSESEIDFDNPKPTLRFSYTKYEFLVEDYDFKLNIDGSINWNN